MSARRSKPMWRYLRPLLAPLLLGGLLFFTLREPVLLWLQGQQRYDEEILKEWIEEARVVQTLPREEIGLTQTPQAFRLEALRSAHGRALGANDAATDDAVLLEAAGFTVGVVEGEPWNFKITFAEDLARANERITEMAAGHRGRDPDA